MSGMKMCKFALLDKKDHVPGVPRESILTQYRYLWLKLIWGLSKIRCFWYWKSWGIHWIKKQCNMSKRGTKTFNLTFFILLLALLYWNTAANHEIYSSKRKLKMRRFMTIPNYQEFYLLLEKTKNMYNLSWR